MTENPTPTGITGDEHENPAGDPNAAGPGTEAGDNPDTLDTPGSPSAVDQLAELNAKHDDDAQLDAGDDTEDDPAELGGGFDPADEFADDDAPTEAPTDTPTDTPTGDDADEDAPAPIVGQEPVEVPDEDKPAPVVSVAYDDDGKLYDVLRDPVTGAVIRKL